MNVIRDHEYRRYINICDKKKKKNNTKPKRLRYTCLKTAHKYRTNSTEIRRWKIVKLRFPGTMFRHRLIIVIITPCHHVYRRIQRYAQTLNAQKYY